MGLTHAFLNLFGIGVDDELCTLGQGQISPSALKDMGEGQEIDDAVVLRDRHTGVVGFQGCRILPVAEHHTFAVARGATGVEDIAEIIVVGLLVECFHFGLAGQILAELQEVFEVKGVGVMRTDTDTVVVDDDTLQRRTQGKHAVSLVVLLLLTDEEETHLRIVDDELYLLFRAGGIDRDRACPDAVRAKVGVEILHTVLREHSNIFLGLDAQVQHGIAHLLDTQRELFPGNSLPFQASKRTERQGTPRPVLLCLLMYQHRQMTSILHSTTYFLLLQR